MNNYFKLEDVADVKLSNVDKKVKTGEKEIRLCNYTDVYKNTYIDKNRAVNFMIASCNEKEFEKFLLKKGQVSITKDSEKANDIGVSTYIEEDFQDVVLGYHLALITPYKEKLDGKYLNYWFNISQAKRYFENNVGGSGQRFTLPLDVILSTPLCLPNIEKQKKISSILFSLDKKIQLLHQINDNLAELAKTIYDYWFVQFDFPDENGKPYKTSGGKMVYNDILKREIPEGWEVKRLGEILKKNETTIKINAKDYLSSGSIPIIDQSSDFICGYTNEISALIKASNIPAIIFGDHTRILKFIDFDFARGADGTQILFSNNEKMPQYLFYHSLLKIDLSNYGYARHFKFLKEQKILLSDRLIAEKFTDNVKTIYEKIKINRNQIQHLQSLRDWLLPMLMNGQVSVE